MKFLIMSVLAFSLIPSAHAIIQQSGIGHFKRAFEGGGNAPEPASAALLLMGAGAIGAKILRNRKKKKDSDKA